MACGPGRSRWGERLTGEDEPAIECGREKESHERPGQGDQQLPWACRAFVPAEPLPDRERITSRRPDSESPRHEDVAEFMKEDTR